MSNLFITESENYLSKKYLKDGYIIVDIKNIKSLEWIRNFYLRFIKNWKISGFLKSRFSYILIFLFSFIPLLKLIKKQSPDF